MTTINTSLPEPPAEQYSLWTTLREAIRGSHQNYTEGPVGRAILLLSIPMVLEMVLESVFAVTDIFFVAKLGPNAIATVGITESMLAMVYAIALGLSIAAAATAVAAAAILSPSAIAYTIASIDSVMPTVAIAFGPSFATKKMSVTAKTDSSTISRTIGIESNRIARPTGPSV